MTATAVKTKAKPHNIMCLEYKVLVEPKEETGFIAFKGGGGLIKPDQLKERDQHASMEGVIANISPFAFGYEQWEGQRKPQVGDTVIFARYSGINVTGDDGVSYRLMNDKDVVAVRGAA